MKTDIEKIEKITSEMALNDIAYLIMQDELDALKADIDCGDYDDFGEKMRRAYFYQRVLSILANEDIPMRATIGLLSTDGILCELYGDRYGFIGESDTDEDIYKYVMEYGYRMAFGKHSSFAFSYADDISLTKTFILSQAPPFSSNL